MNKNNSNENQYTIIHYTLISIHQSPLNYIFLAPTTKKKFVTFSLSNENVVIKCYTTPLFSLRNNHQYSTKLNECIIKVDIFFYGPHSDLNK